MRDIHDPKMDIAIIAISILGLIIVFLWVALAS
jgi:hypothetical protein